MSNIDGKEVPQIAHPNISSNSFLRLWNRNLLISKSQVDGEPWIQPAGDIVVLKSALKASSE